jgi:hypothetical protein
LNLTMFRCGVSPPLAGRDDARLDRRLYDLFGNGSARSRFFTTQRMA